MELEKETKEITLEKVEVDEEFMKKLNKEVIESTREAIEDLRRQRIYAMKKARQEFCGGYFKD